MKSLSTAHLHAMMVRSVHMMIITKNCVTVFWTGCLHLLENCHFHGVEATCLPHKGGHVPLKVCPRIKQENLQAFFLIFWFDYT